MTMSTINPVPADLSVLIEFPEAYYYLQPLLAMYCNDKDPTFFDAILRLVIKDVLDYANQWADSNSLEYARDAVFEAGTTMDVACEIVKTAQDIVSVKMSNLLPDFSISRYSGKYTYTFLGGPYGRILFNYWINGAPGGGRQAPGPEGVFK